MKTLLLHLSVIFTFVVIYSGDVIARTPKCGEISKRDVKEVFSIAEDVEFYHDVVEDINNTCMILEVFDDWEGSQRKARVSNKAFKISKNDIISSISRQFNIMRRPLIIMNTWLDVDTSNFDEEVKRVVRIRKARNDIKIIQAELAKLRTDLRELMYS